MSLFAPVAVFAYRRRAHLERTLASLAANVTAAQTELYVYCDAARKPSEQAEVDAVRDLVASTSGFAAVTPIHREVNFGLARSIIEGTDEVLRRHGRAIIVEDDLVLSPHFLRYMNDGLDRYADDTSVASIHGYSYPVDDSLPETFFLRGADCWGWATWSRGWRHFDTDGARLLAELKQRDLSYRFDLDGNFAFTRMLEDQIAGRNDSWAIRWHASCFLKGLLTLYPGHSLVDNIGNDSSGTHSRTTDAFSVALSQEPVSVNRILVQESSSARDAFKAFLRRQRPGILGRARSAAHRTARVLGWPP